MNDVVKTSLDAGVMTIRMTRPEKKNALNHALYAGLVEGLKQAEASKEVRAILLAGSEGIFTAGNDLKDFAESPPHGGGASSAFEFISMLPRIEKPLVAAVDGPAVGVGTTMLLHCDLVFVSDRAQLHLPFVNLALLPEAGSSYLLPRLMGHVRAAELILLGQPFDAARAVELGIANRCVAPEDVEKVALAAAAELAAKPPEAVRKAKALLKADRASVEAAMERESGAFAKQLQTAEAKEAFAAFFEKRKPDFASLAG